MPASKRYPPVLATTLLALLAIHVPARAAPQVPTAAGIPARTGLAQRAFVQPASTDVFAGSLLPSGRDGDRWAPVWFPYALSGPPPGDSAGTEATLFGGARALAGGRFRHAARAGGGSFLDVSAHYLRGTDWPSADPVAARLRAIGAFLPAPDDQLERWGGEIRYDLRRGDSGGWTFEAGLDRLRGNQLTEVGAAGATGWTRWHGRARYRRGRLSADAEARGRGAGEAFFHRTGQPIEDQSLLLAGRLRHSTLLGDRQLLEYGLDLRNTLPFTNGTVTGVHEDADAILVAGGHLRSLTRLSGSLDLDAALQAESHSRVRGLNFSGLATLAFRPAAGHGLRATVSRLANMPSADNFLLDVSAGRVTAGALIHDARARGVPESGFTFDNRCAGGFHDLCMRSPLAPGEKLPADPSVLWNTLVEIAAASDPAALRPLRPFFRDPEPGELLPRLLLYDHGEWGAGRPPFLGEEVRGRPVAVRPIDPLRPSVARTLALEYELALPTRRGSAAEADHAVRGRVSAGIWRSVIDDFIGPLRAETPAVFFDPASLRAFLERRVDVMVRSGIVYPELARFLVNDLTNLASQIPVGAIVPDQVATPGLLLTYRNLGRVDVSGANLSASVSPTSALTVEAAYRYVTEDCFDFVAGVATDCSGPDDVSLNVPRTRSSFSVRYRARDAGFSAEARVRRQRGFHATAGVFAGRVEGYTVLDARVRFPVPRLPRASAAVTATNLFDDRHQEFVGAPEIGRLVVASLTYAFR